MRIFLFSSTLLGMAILSGCGEKATERESIPQAEKLVTESTNIYMLDNKAFIIPSPVQTMQLFKKVAYKYDKTMLNAPDKLTTYKTKFEKAVNIGIYGGDLGYIILNEQNQDAISYMTPIKKLTEELGAISAFDGNVLSSLEKNVGNQSELLKVITGAYKKCDEFFKENEQGDIAAAIIAGGWLESVHHAGLIAKATKNHDMVTRFGEQKQALDNLIQLLNPYYSKREAAQYSAFVDDLTALQSEFKGVGEQYVYKESTTDAAKKVTVVNSTTTTTVSDFLLEKLVRMTEMVRDKVINNHYQNLGSSSADTTVSAQKDSAAKK